MTSTKAIVVVTAASLLSFAAGAATGVMYAKKKLGQEFDERLAKETAATKRFYSRLHKRDENDMPAIVETAESLPVEREAIQAMQRYQGNNTAEETPREEPVYETIKTHVGGHIPGNNVFDGNSMDIEDYEALIQTRDEKSPHIITLAEYMNNEPEFEQSSITYFQVDGILVDERDAVIDNPDEIVGDDNLTRFGSFSGDPRVVLVRNNTLQHDFEVNLHEGSYAYVVHGIINDQNKHTVPSGG